MRGQTGTTDEYLQTLHTTKALMQKITLTYIELLVYDIRTIKDFSLWYYTLMVKFNKDYNISLFYLLL